MRPKVRGHDLSRIGLALKLQSELNFRAEQGSLRTTALRN
jgi:hypothetical protein